MFSVFFIMISYDEEGKKERDSPPVISSGDENEVREHIRKLTKPIFDKVLQETPKNRVSVGGTVSKEDRFSYYQPHNCRLYFDFSKVGFVPPKPFSGNVWYGVCFSYGDYKVINVVEHSFDNFLGCKILVKRSQVEVTNKINVDRRYVIYHFPVEQVEEQILDVLVKKYNECFKALKKFIELFGGGSDFNLLRLRVENKLEREEVIDLLPLSMKFQNRLVKKVYNERNVEFSSPVLACNYLSNSALGSVTPELKQELGDLRGVVSKGFSTMGKELKALKSSSIALSERLLPTIESLRVNVEAHISAIRGIDRGLERFNEGLGVFNRRLAMFPMEAKVKKKVLGIKKDSKRLYDDLFRSGFRWRWVLW